MSEDRLYAGELRAMGIAIDDRIPDCAHIPRSACIYTQGETRVEGDQLTMGLTISFAKPFEWFEVNVTMDVMKQ